MKNYTTCAKEATPRCEPLMPSELPQHPWQKIGTDMFQLRGENYLLAVDYFSRYPEAIKLNGTTSGNIIQALKAMFSHHGIPQTVISDNGPQYSSQEFKTFAREYNFSHVTSIPLYPRSNAQAAQRGQYRQ